MPGPLTDPGPPDPRPIPAAAVAPVAGWDQDLYELDLVRARIGQLAGGLGAVVAGGVALSVAPAMGGAVVVMALATVGFYSALHALLSGAPRPWMRWASYGFEVAIPTALLWILARTEGPHYALGSWVPAQLYAVFVVASILGLNPRVPLIMGLAAAASYGGVWLGAIRPLVADDELLHQPAMQVVRLVSLVLIGFASSISVAWIRRVLGRAARTSHERELFGRYKLGDEIAAGGMGRVVEATWEGGFRRRVAIKLLHPHLARDPAHVERFRAEAEISARLAHPNVVAGLDFGPVGDTWFLVMEYVDGKPLSDLLNERRRLDRPLEPRVVARIGEQIAAALEWAHTGARDDEHRPLGVVHRDLSPSNVLVDRSGRIRITDFGVARTLRGAASVITGNLVGKPSYVAPEALRDQGIDPRADLWSLGVILWEALTNTRLFARETDASALLAVVEAEIPPPSALRPGLDPRWDRLVAGLLTRDRDQRTSTATEVRVALLALLAGQPPLSERDVHELLAPEEVLEELPLDETSEEASEGLLHQLELDSPEPTDEVDLPQPEAPPRDMDAPPALAEPGPDPDSAPGSDEPIRPASSAEPIVADARTDEVVGTRKQLTPPVPNPSPETT
jgi:eukaryotic-like serine/threonine-protein kinase